MWSHSYKKAFRSSDVRADKGIQASIAAGYRASANRSRRGKRLSGQECYGCEAKAALVPTRSHDAESSWPEPYALPFECHVAGMTKIPWIPPSSSLWHEVHQRHVRTLLGFGPLDSGVCKTRAKSSCFFSRCPRILCVLRWKASASHRVRGFGLNGGRVVPHHRSFLDHLRASGSRHEHRMLSLQRAGLHGPCSHVHWALYVKVRFVFQPWALFSMPITFGMILRVAKLAREPARQPTKSAGGL